MLFNNLPATIAVAIAIVIFAMVWPNIQLKLEVKRRENQDEA